MLQRALLLCFLLVTTTSLSVVVYAAVPVDGVLSVAHTETTAYLAIGVDIPEGQALSAVHWVNNDETSQPTIRVVPSSASGLPDVSASWVGIDQPTWSSLDWMEASLVGTATSSTGSCFALFEYPAYNETEDVGVGGGCGIAYRYGGDAYSALISHDGETWVGIHPSVQVLFEADFVPAGGATVLEGGSAKRAPDEDVKPEIGMAAQSATLGHAYPNPFNPSTNLVFRLAQESDVALAIYDARGRLVRSLRSDRYPAGEYRVQWSGRNSSGQVVASGIYFARLVAAGDVQVQRLVLMK